MRRSLLALCIAALAVVTVLLVGLLVWGRGGDDDPLADVPVPADPTPRIQANAVLTPRTVAFGDTITARVDVTLDRDRVDPDSVRVATDFTPWRPTVDVDRRRRDGETTTHLRTTWTLRCLASACLPPALPLHLPFPPATVTYDTVEKQVRPARPLNLRWPELVVQSRLDATGTSPASGSGSSPFETPWRADLVSMPSVSYRLDPDAARLPLFAAAGGFALLGLGLVYLGRPRRRPQLVLAPEEPPTPVLTPVEQALALLEDSVAADGAADRRRALELVAAELAGRGNHDLAQLVRRLAWSRQTPEVERTTPLAEQVRPALGLDEEPEPEVADADETERATPHA